MPDKIKETTVRKTLKDFTDQELLILRIQLSLTKSDKEMYDIVEEEVIRRRRGSIPNG